MFLILSGVPKDKRTGEQEDNSEQRKAKEKWGKQEGKSREIGKIEKWGRNERKNGLDKEKLVEIKILGEGRILEEKIGEQFVHYLQIRISLGMGFSWGFVQ